jgi:hypothetical protein
VSGSAGAVATKKTGCASIQRESRLEILFIVCPMRFSFDLGYGSG